MKILIRFLVFFLIAYVVGVALVAVDEAAQAKDIYPVVRGAHPRFGGHVRPLQSVLV